MTRGRKDNMERSIPAGIEALIEVFEQELADVSFPDVNAGELAALRVEVEERIEMVKHARATLERAELGLEEAIAELNRKAEAGLSYAKVFAKGKSHIEERLRSILLTKQTTGRPERPPIRTDSPRPARTSTKTRFGHDALTASLPFVDDESAVYVTDLPLMNATDPS